MYHNEIFMWNNKAFALTIQMLLTRLKYSKSKPDSKAKVTRYKMRVPMESSCLRECSCKIQKSRGHCQKLLAVLK